MENLTLLGGHVRLACSMLEKFIGRDGSILTHAVVFFLFAAGCASSGAEESETTASSGGASSGGALVGPGVGGGADGGADGATGGTSSGAGGVVGGSTGGTLGAGGTGGAGDVGSGGALVGSGGTTGIGGAPSGGQSGFSTDRADFGLGAESRCSADFTICEDFESTAPGSLPTGFTLGGYGTRTLGVTEAESARGTRALQIDIDGGQAAVVAMLSIDNIGNLGAAHFGRMFYRIEGPGVNEFIHFDVLEAVGPWMDHQNGVRFASTGTGVGTTSNNWSWIYNVQPFDGGGGEFGSEGDRSAHPVVDEWMCLEWAFDSGAQTATYYHDGAAIDYLVIDDEQSEIPVFTGINIGFQKFQSTGALRVWVDELALDEARVGCNH